MEKEDGAVKQCDVRGLRRCCSTDCSRASFKDRDSVYILRCFLERERPKSLSRSPGEAKLEMKSSRFALANSVDDGGGGGGDS